ISPMAPNHTSPQDEPPEEVEASSEEEVDREEEEESESQPESKSEEPEPKGAPTPVDEKKPQPKNPDLATVPQSSSPGSEKWKPRLKKKLTEKKRKNPDPSCTYYKKKPDSAMEETPKTKKPRSNASATTTSAAKAGSKQPSSKNPIKKLASATTTPAARARSKRPSESDPKDSKRPKKKKIPELDEEPDQAREETKKAGGDDLKKLLLLQRIWSDDDEITILEGMIDYYTKQGVHPNADMFAFHDFMKKSLKADVNKTQLQDKIRRLKKKYETDVSKGKKYNPVKPHELWVFDLSKKVWGSSEGLFALGGLSEQYKCNETCAGLRELTLLEGCLELIGEPKRAELKEEWKKLHVAELELVIRRGELAKLILEALK
ncbi:hypothetical protein PRUPE_7G003400, partial [Prunus persica]